MSLQYFTELLKRPVVLPRVARAAGRNDVSDVFVTTSAARLPMVPGDVFRSQLGVAVDTPPTEMPKHRLPFSDRMRSLCFGSFCPHLHADGDAFLSITGVTSKIMRPLLGVVGFWISFASEFLRPFVSCRHLGVQPPPRGAVGLKPRLSLFRMLCAWPNSGRTSFQFFPCKKCLSMHFPVTPDSVSPGLRMDRVLSPLGVVRPPARGAVPARPGLLERYATGIAVVAFSHNMKYIPSQTFCQGRAA